MKNKEYIDQQLTKDYDFYTEVAINIVGGDEEKGIELLHFVISNVYFIPENKINNIKEKDYFKFYLIKRMKNEYNWRESAYNRLINKFQNLANELNPIENDEMNPEEITVTNEEIEDNKNKIYQINKEIQNNPNIIWWKGQIFLIYMLNHLTYSKLSKQTKIPASSLWHAVQEVKGILINKLNK